MAHREKQTVRDAAKKAVIGKEKNERTSQN